MGEHIDSDGASSRLLALSMQDHHKATEHAESEHAQDIQGSVGRPSGRSGVPPQIDPIVLMATLTALQGSMANIATISEKQSATNNPSVAPAPVAT